MSTPTGSIQANVSSSTEDELVQNGSIALSIVVVIGICFLVLNVCACAGVFYQRDRVRFKEMLLQKQYKLRPATERSSPGTRSERGADKDKGGLIAMSLFKTSKLSKVKGRDQYKRAANDEESVDELPQSLPHQASTSTMDPHTKVSQWMAQEVNGSSSPISQFQMRTNATTTGTLEDDSRCYAPSHAHSNTLVAVEEENCQAQAVTSTSTTSLSHSKKKKSPTSATGRPITCITKAPSHSAGRSSKSGRKTRVKSQLLNPASIVKKDVGVGDDDVDQDQEMELAVQPQSTMDTIRRLNLPKVLPDLPDQQEQSKRRSDAEKVENVPKVPKVNQVETAGLQPQVASAGNAKCAATSTIYKSNLPTTMVVAPHPRLASGGSHRPVPAAKMNIQMPAEEPQLTVRPGPRSDSSCQTYAPTADVDVVLRRHKNPAAAAARPASSSSINGNRNSRSWYAQYSQSFISKSIDQDGEDKAT